MAEEVSILDKLGVGIGYKVSVMKTITEADILLFAAVSSDFNQVHINEEFAKKTPFGTRIAHGIISVGLLSAAMTKLPGLTIFLGTSAKFVKPVHIGDTITATGEVIAARKDKGIVTLKNTCTNQKGEIVTEGESVIRIYPRPE